MCTPLAIVTVSLLLLVSFCLRMPVHPWMFWACLMVWIVLHYCIDLYIASPLLPTMSTSCCHSLHLPISLCCYCVVLTCMLPLSYCIALCICIYPSVYSEYRFIFLLLTHMSACDFISLAGRKIYFVLILCIITCILPLTLTFIVCFHNCWGQSPLPPPL